MGKLSRTKGAAFERLIARLLRPIFPDAHRQPQSQIAQMKEISEKNPDFRPCLTDVVAGPFGVECKHRRNLPDIWDTLAQAEGDCGKSGKIPVAVHKPNGKGMSGATVLAAGCTLMSWDEFIEHCWTVKSWLEINAKENRHHWQGPAT